MYETSRWFFASKVRLMLLFKNCSHYYFQFQTPLSVLLSPFLHSPSIGLIECFTSLSVSLSISPSLLLKHSKKKVGTEVVILTFLHLWPSWPPVVQRTQKTLRRWLLPWCSTKHWTWQNLCPPPPNTHTHNCTYYTIHTLSLSHIHAQARTHNQWIEQVTLCKLLPHVSSDVNTDAKRE